LARRSEAFPPLRGLIRQQNVSKGAFFFARVGKSCRVMTAGA